MKLALKNWDNPTSTDRLQVVFLHRNQDYGAYLVRKNYEKTILKAFVITCIVVTILAFSPLIYQKLFPKIIENNVGSNDFTFEIQNPEIEELNQEIKSEELQPKSEEPTPTTIKDLIPIVVNHSTTDTVYPQDILTISNTGIIKSDGDSTYDNKNLLFEENKNGNIDNTIRDFVEEMPIYPGGELAMLQYLQSNMKYPSLARENNIQGTVYLSFVVGKNGEIINLTVKRGIGFGCEEEAIRVVKSMPVWIPGKSNGHPVFVNYMLPIKFSLQ